MLLCSLRKYGLTTKLTKDTKGFDIFQTPNFVIFVSFVVNIFLPIWLRRSRARLSVVKFLSYLFALTRQTLPPLSSATSKAPSGATVTPTGRP
jgi:hypothetical protein